MADAAPQLRLFFALWPDAATRAALAGLQRPPGRQAGGVPVAPENLHLTMAFLGMQPAHLLPAIGTVLNRLTLPDMTLQVDRYGYFPRARIAWAGMSRPPEALVALHEDLGTAIRQCGIGYDQPSAFRPHITLMRHAAQGCASDPAPVCWRTPQLALVQSDTTPGGPVYRVLGQCAAR